MPELKKQVQALPPNELERFSQWFDTYRETSLLATPAEPRPEDLSEEQKEEILRRRAAYLADPSMATPWTGTAERLLDQLRARRRQKASPGRS
jgi:hypothetical protein